MYLEFSTFEVPTIFFFRSVASIEDFTLPVKDLQWLFPFIFGLQKLLLQKFKFSEEKPTTQPANAVSKKQKNLQKGSAKCSMLATSCFVSRHR